MHFEFCWCIQLKIAFRRIWMLLQRILATAGIGQTDSFPTETWNFFCGRGVYSQFTHNALFTISPSNLLFANNSQAWYFTIRNAISLVAHRPRADGRNSWKIVERWPQMIISSICSCLIGQSDFVCFGLNLHYSLCRGLWTYLMISTYEWMYIYSFQSLLL